MSFCGRLRGDFLNMTALLCGSRFGRGLVRPGGVGFDLDDAHAAQLVERLEQALRDVTSAVELLWNTSSVRARFENAGTVSREMCYALGLVGPAARACGVERDVRQDFPFGIFRFIQVPVSTFHTGDVFARAFVRWLEIQRSVAFICDQLKALPVGPIRGELQRPARCSCRWWKAGAERSVTSQRRTRGVGSRITRWLIRPSITGWDWRWHCATSRSPISRCATRALTCPTADTISEVIVC